MGQNYAQLVISDEGGEVKDVEEECDTGRTFLCC